MKVAIINSNPDYTRMFLNRGWEVTPDFEEADLVQFTGGADVSPSLYDEAEHLHTGTNPARDEYEQSVFYKCIRLRKPMAGICRGGQLLNVLNGGCMYQHVGGHAIGGYHEVVATRTGKRYLCTSTHHQMMRPAFRGALVLGVASECTFREHMEGDTVVREDNIKDGEDVEVVWYPKSKSLCFQPHPETMSPQSTCQQWYFNLIDEYLFRGE